MMYMEMIDRADEYSTIPVRSYAMGHSVPVIPPGRTDIEEGEWSEIPPPPVQWEDNWEPEDMDVPEWEPDTLPEWEWEPVNPFWYFIVTFFLVFGGLTAVYGYIFLAGVSVAGLGVTLALLLLGQGRKRK